MQFKSITFILACAMATGLMASPFPEQQSNAAFASTEYLEMIREEASTGEGFIVYYGPPNSTRTLQSGATGVEARRSCATTGVPSCHTSNTARNDVCAALVNELGGDANVALPQAPRQVCYEGTSESNAYCCVSWHNAVNGLLKLDLAYVATSSKQTVLLLLIQLLLLRELLCPKCCLIFSHAFWNTWNTRY